MNPQETSALKFKTTKKIFVTKTATENNPTHQPSHHATDSRKKLTLPTISAPPASML
jgi:hypothetical protein